MALSFCNLSYKNVGLLIKILRIHDGPRLVTIALGLSRGPARRDGLCDIEGLWTGMGRERGWREGGERLDPIYAVREGGAPERRYSPWAQGVDMR